MKTVAELREIAHRAKYYDDSHGDLPVVEFVPYLCDDSKETVAISYRDIAEVFNFVAGTIEAMEAAYRIGQRGT